MGFVRRHAVDCRRMSVSNESSEQLINQFGASPAPSTSTGDFFQFETMENFSSTCIVQNQDNQRCKLSFTISIVGASSKDRGWAKLLI